MTTTHLNWRFVPHPTVDIDPRVMSDRKKNINLVCISLLATSAGFASLIYFPGVPGITADLNAPPIAITLTAALFALFTGIAPVFWASASDHYHIRRLPNLLSMVIFSAASLGMAFVKNIWALVVLRCLQAVGASCGQAVGAGMIADLYELEERGSAFGKYFFGMFIGPLLGPIVGGFLSMSAVSWRATFWFCFALGVVIFILCFLFLNETYRDNSKFDHVNEVSDAKSATLVEDQPRKKALNPIDPFLMLRHPFVFIASFTGGVMFGGMFAIETIIPKIYEDNYGFSAWQTGLSYTGAGLGNAIGSVVGGYLSDRLLLRSRARRGGRAVVEDRLTANCWPGGFILVPLGQLLFGWMAQTKGSVWACIVAFGIQTFGMNQVMAATSAYLVDAMPGQGASASAAATLFRQAMACILTLAANPMVAAIGPGWTTVFLAGLTVFSMALLAILAIYGERLRRWSGYEDKLSQ
ncbi:major facilitator superfamily domain-containing protein [Phycomyces blakesleeanus]|uniref:Major facilitator superfamily domain-containing protein n=1 Tax=Phycomyces blakesleeanus TaxID=4837 RepID=A0ABR3B4U8_PHYBL